jgi:hypothetical protein
MYGEHIFMVLVETKGKFGSMEEAMRIDAGPSLSEIKLSITRGTTVMFYNSLGEQVRGKVLYAMLDPGAGRVASVLEEEKTELIWLARYRYGAVGRACGEIVPWKLRRNEIDNSANGSLWRKCSGE